jgi:transposase
MDGMVRLSGAEVKSLRQIVRLSESGRKRLAAHILLLLAQDCSWSLIARVLLTSPSQIARCQKRYQVEGLTWLLASAKPTSAPIWVTWIITLVLQRDPRSYAFARSRWTCEAISIVLLEERQVKVSRETIRRYLRRAGLVWRRPRPALRPKDPDYQTKLACIRQLLRNLRPYETALFVMKSISTPTRRSARCGCAEVSKLSS